MMSEQRQILTCRLCDGASLSEILDLGRLCYTGRFPAEDQEDPPSAPLAIVQCKHCSLVQLKHSYPPEEMYGMTYGYRSAVTETMRKHLNKIKSLAFEWMQSKGSLKVLDIGSNDGTLLNCFNDGQTELTGIDPCADKHRDNYPERAIVINKFFSATNVQETSGPNKFDIITSIAMFYDIENPVQFAKDIHALLAAEGVWIAEQTHSHTLIEANCYDSICHEHVTYLSLGVMEDICEHAGLKILDIRTNNINGGSLAAVIAKKDSAHRPNITSIHRFNDKEQALNLIEDKVWSDFRARVEKHRNDLSSYIEEARKSGKTVLGYGASTKGNVLLQYCGVTRELVPAILERDPNKFGKVTPGTRIPIISEEEGRAMNPDVLLVFPWHFKDEIIRREEKFLKSGGTLLFPFPTIEVIRK